MPYLRLKALQSPKACLRVLAGMSPTLLPLLLPFLLFPLLLPLLLLHFFRFFLVGVENARTRVPLFCNPLPKRLRLISIGQKTTSFVFCFFFKYNSKQRRLRLPESKTVSFWISCHLPKRRRFGLLQFKTTLFWDIYRIKKIKLMMAKTMLFWPEKLYFATPNIQTPIFALFSTEKYTLALLTSISTI